MGALCCVCETSNFEHEEKDVEPVVVVAALGTEIDKLATEIGWERDLLVPAEDAFFQTDSMKICLEPKLPAVSLFKLYPLAET